MSTKVLGGTGATIPEGRTSQKFSTTADGQVAPVGAPPRTLAELNRPDNPDGIFSKDEAKQKLAVAELNKLLAAEMIEDETDALANESVQSLRERFGISAPKLPHPDLQAWFDTEAESVGLATLASWGVSSDVARDLHQHVLDVGIGNLGGPATEAQYQEFAERFKGRISDEQISALVSWHRGLRGA